MASGNTLCVFTPHDNEPPSSNNARFDTRNGHLILLFDPTTAQVAIFTGILPRHYAGGGVTVYAHWSATSAVTGTIGWTIEIERVGTALDVDADSFASAQTITAATVSGTAGILIITNVAITDGANMDSLAVGEIFRLRITRDVANDDAAGDAELHAIEIKET